MNDMDSQPESDRLSTPAFINDPLVLFRRAALWTVLCSVSAAPSFFWAHAEFSRPAMVTGVVVFIVFYTAATGTQAFHRFSRRPFVRRTLYIGYGARVASSVFFPLGIVIDLFPGMVSVMLVEGVFRNDRSFIPTLIATMIQGALLNGILGVFMLIVYGLQRAFLQPPPLDDGTCQRCGYDLRASYEFGRCPECGTPCAKPVAS